MLETSSATSAVAQSSVITGQMSLVAASNEVESNLGGSRIHVDDTVSRVTTNDSVVLSKKTESKPALAPRVTHLEGEPGAMEPRPAISARISAGDVVTCIAPSGTSQAPLVATQLGASLASTTTIPRAAQMEAVNASVAALTQTQLKVHAKKQSPSERLQRSRERNRMHARKTRQRKKEHVQTLQNRAEELKQEQIRLRQVINEKNTANILVGLFSQGNSRITEDPRVEVLLRRPVDDIPDASKIPELPALILPGQHSSKKNKASSSSSAKAARDFPDDGIDYELLGKDRSQCTPEELDQIRKERNRMHAKRTRDRKRLFMEEMEEMIKTLQGENEILVCHANDLNADQGCSSEHATPSLVSPSLKPASPTLLELPPSESLPQAAKALKRKPQDCAQIDQIKSLLAAAGSFDLNQQCGGLSAISSVASVVSATHSASGSVADEQVETMSDGSTSPRPNKRHRIEAAPSTLLIVSAVPASIATIGC